MKIKKLILLSQENGGKNMFKQWRRVLNVEHHVLRRHYTDWLPSTTNYDWPPSSLSKGIFISGTWWKMCQQVKRQLQQKQSHTSGNLSLDSFSFCRYFLRSHRRGYCCFHVWLYDFLLSAPLHPISTVYAVSLESLNISEKHSQFFFILFPAAGGCKNIPRPHNNSN